jgi:acyl-CoA thioester hydrolase
VASLIAFSRPSPFVHSASPVPTADAEPDVFDLPVRVYWEDTDAGGVVFYANYLKFFERARTEWLRSMGFGQERLRVETGTVFIVSETAVRYLQPARLDDQLRVTVQVQDCRRASLTIRQQAWRGDVLLAEGTIRIGCVEAQSFRPCRIPNEIYERIA